MRQSLAMRAMLLAMVVCAGAMLASPVLAQIDVFRTIIGIAAEKARQEQLDKASEARGGKAASEASASVAEVQGRLKQLGYYRGTVDGVSGKGTSAAIRAWQADNGLAVTGEIDAGQYRTLMDGPAAPAAQAGTATVTAGGEALNLLYDTDLPYNDYTSGKNDPSLKNTTLDVCMARCAGDAMCRAFTYNSNARFCFLKSAIADPERFSGAISGYKGPAGIASAPATSASRDLRSSEIRDLQEALNGLGYDTGKPDGRKGNKTRRAVAAFLADHPGVATGNFDTALFNAVIGTATGAAPAGGVDPKSYVDVASAQRQLVLLAIADKPERIAADYEMQRQLLEDRKAKVGPMDAAAQYDAYSAANDIEKAKLLDAYRSALVAEAKAAAPEPARQVLRVRIAARTQLGSFVDGEGLVVGTPRDELFGGGKLDLSLSTLGIDLVGVVPDMPDRFRLPFDDAEKASAFLDDVARRSANSYVDLVAYLTLTGFGADSNLSGGTTATQDDFPVTVSLDKLAIVSVRNGNDTQAMPGGEELAVLRTVARPVAADPLAIAAAYGLPIIQNRLVLPADSGSEYVVSNLVRANYENALSRFINLAILAKNPDLAKDGIDNDLVVSLLSRAQRLQIYGDQERTSNWLNNEFQLRRAREALNNEVIPQLVAAAPQLPVPVVTVKRMRLGAYDFAGKVFPLEADTSNTSLFMLPGTFGKILPMQGFGQLPRYLPMDEAAAEQIVAGVDSYERPSVYIAVYGELQFTTVDGKLAIRMVAERAGLYRDMRLETPMIDLDLIALLSDAEGMLDWRPDAEAVRAPIPEPEEPKEDVPVAEAAAPLPPKVHDTPESRFDLLGLSLGMPLDEARRILEARLEGKTFTPLTQRNDRSSDCEIIDKALAAALAAGGADTAEIRLSFVDDFTAKDCLVPENTVLDFAFGFDVDLGNGQTDRIVVFRAPQSGEVVGAVAREVSDEMMEAMNNGLVDKYGSNFLTPRGADNMDRYWIDSPDMAVAFSDTYDSDCDPVWPYLERPPRLYLTQDCGTFVRQLYRQVLLIDTRYNAYQAGLIGKRVAAAAAAQPRVSLEF